MPTVFLFIMILKGRAIVKDPTVVDEEQIALFQREFDSKGWIVRHFVESVERSSLEGCQRLTNLFVAGLDPVTKIAIHQSAIFPGNHRSNCGRPFAPPNAATAIDVKRLIKDFQQFGMPGQQFVVDAVAADNLTQSAALGRVDAKQADIVRNVVAERIVGVKATLGIGDRKTSAVANVLPRIAHIVKQSALHVLRKGVTKQLADEPVTDLQFMRRKAVACRSLDDGEAATVFESDSHGFQFPSTGGARLLGRAKRGWRLRVLAQPTDRFIERLQAARRQRIIPRLAVIDGVGSPGASVGDGMAQHTDDYHARGQEIQRGETILVPGISKAIHRRFSEVSVLHLLLATALFVPRTDQQPINRCCRSKLSTQASDGRGRVESCQLVHVLLLSEPLLAAGDPDQEPLSG